MGLAIEEKAREDRAIEFYNLLSSFDYMAYDPDPVQRRYPASTAVELLPDHRSG